MAALHGCTAIGVDYVPALLARGRDATPPRGSTSSCSRATPRHCRSPTRSFDAVLVGLRVDVRPGPGAGRRRAAPRLPSPAGRSHWRAGRRRASSASCSARSPPTSRRPPACARRCSGEPRSVSASLFGEHDLVARGDRAEVHVPVPVRRSEFVDVLPPLVRPDPEGVRRSRQRCRRQRARERPRRSSPADYDRLGTGDAIAIPATYTEAVAITW